MKKLQGKIYFDMDGVLADFGMRARYITKTTGFTTKSDGFWEIVNNSADSFYSKLPPINDIFDLVYKLKNEGFNLNILSKVPYSCKNKAMIGKTIWLNEWYKDVFYDVIFIPTQNEKHFYCKSQDILIDDDIINIDKWRDSGGIGIVYTKGNAQKLTKDLNEIFKSNLTANYFYPEV